LLALRSGPLDAAGNSLPKRKGPRLHRYANRNQKDATHAEGVLTVWQVTKEQHEHVRVLLTWFLVSRADRYRACAPDRSSAQSGSDGALHPSLPIDTLHRTLPYSKLHHCVFADLPRSHCAKLFFMRKRRAAHTLLMLDCEQSFQATTRRGLGLRHISSCEQAASKGLSQRL